MGDYRLYSKIKAAFALNPIVRTANATVDGDIIDRTSEGANVLFAIVTGVVTDGTWTFTIKDSDDGSSFSAAAAGDIQGAPVAIVAADDNTFKELAYKGNKRYVRLSVTSTGSTTGALIGAVAITDGGRKPVLR